MCKVTPCDGLLLQKHPEMFVSTVRHTSRGDVIEDMVDIPCHAR